MAEDEAEAARKRVERFISADKGLLGSDQDWHLGWRRSSQKRATLDGRFSPAELRAIADHMEQVTQDRRMAGYIQTGFRRCFLHCRNGRFGERGENGGMILKRYAIVPSELFLPSNPDRDQLLAELERYAEEVRDLPEGYVNGH